MGRALRARPIGTVVFPFVCGVNVGALLCGVNAVFPFVCGVNVGGVLNHIMQAL